MNHGTIAYRCAPGITWIKDRGQAILVADEGRRSWTLRGIEAALWDWLALGYSAADLTRFLALAQGIPGDQARRTLAAIARAWEKEGILCLEGNGRDQPGD